MANGRAIARKFKSAIAKTAATLMQEVTYLLDPDQSPPHNSGDMLRPGRALTPNPRSMQPSPVSIRGFHYAESFQTAPSDFHPKLCLRVSNPSLYNHSVSTSSLSSVLSEPDPSAPYSTFSLPSTLSLPTCCEPYSHNKRSGPEVHDVDVSPEVAHRAAPLELESTTHSLQRASWNKRPHSTASSDILLPIQYSDVPTILLNDEDDPLQPHEIAGIGEALSANTPGLCSSFYPLLSNFPAQPTLQGDGSRYPDFIAPTPKYGKGSARVRNFSRREFSFYNKNKPLPAVPIEAESSVGQHLADPHSPGRVHSDPSTHKQPLPGLSTARVRPLSRNSAQSEGVVSSSSTIDEESVDTNSNHWISQPQHGETFLPKTHKLRKSRHTPHFKVSDIPTLPLFSGLHPLAPSFTHNLASQLRHRRSARKVRRTNRYSDLHLYWCKDKYVPRPHRPTSIEPYLDEHRAEDLCEAIELDSMFIYLSEPLQDLGGAFGLDTFL